MIVKDFSDQTTKVDAADVIAIVQVGLDEGTNSARVLADLGYNAADLEVKVRDLEAILCKPTTHRSNPARPLADRIATAINTNRRKGRHG